MISRTTLIGALVVVELGIVGMAASAVTGSVPLPSMFATSSFQMPNVEESTRTPLDRTLATGPSPHVLIDVHDLHATVETANVPAVRVVETVHKDGLVLNGREEPVSFERTADGVRVTTPAGAGDVVVIGDFDQTVRIIVPPTAQVEVTGAEPLEVSGLRSKLVAHIVTGPLTVKNHRGDLDLSVRSEGRIVLDDVQAGVLAANTHDGRLLFSRVGADRLDATTDSGRISAVDLRAINGALTTRDGHVNVSFAPNSDATVSAHTASGSVRVSGLASEQSEKHSATVQLGDGEGHFEVSTDSGQVNLSQGASV
ncbi:MAG: DUF4097 family beta strand repeat protein [Candidatus Eremiobacteraeota bacterium]|nr:DUF4097 family beta strand repeat protein [Candidatus Eremiobacteraeota bacterium]